MTQAEQGGNGGVFARSHYQYDNLSREVATWRDEDGSKGERFGYNVTNQLTSAAYKADQVWTGNPRNATRTVGYNYTPDTLNRSIVTENGIGTGYVADGMNQYTAIGAQAPGYDGNFNLTSYTGATYSYNSVNQLTAASNPGTASAQFVYDGSGRCVKRTINSAVTVITFDEWNPIYERDGSGNFKAWNIYGARADEILVHYDVSVGPLIYKQDREGNVVFLLDGNGNGLEKYSYDAFGTPTVTEWNGNYPRSASWRNNRFMFQGREYFPELGIYDYRHRMYHPGLGRFLQMDPTGFDAGDMNLFRYCDDDPVDRSDPSGLWADHTYTGGFNWWDIGASPASSAASNNNSHPAGIMMASISLDDEEPKGGGATQGASEEMPGVNVHWDITSRIRLVPNVTKRDNQTLVKERGEPVAAGTRYDFGVTPRDAHNVTVHLSIDTQIATNVRSKWSLHERAKLEFQTVQKYLDWSSKGDGGYLARTAFRNQSYSSPQAAAEREE